MDCFGNREYNFGNRDNRNSNMVCGIFRNGNSFCDSKRMQWAVGFGINNGNG